ncbi:MAG: indole-3-glycerol-phosphate synthase TrpC, partial [Dehalococcoidales bacterium]|nr:indole-3-glycerol-phosphate synthase TrpC [Dehalococcoidales bacterium]
MILDDIVADTKRELEDIKRSSPVDKLEKMVLVQPPTKSLSKALTGSGIKLIAEVKKASPSKGVICKDFNPVKIAKIYAGSGAAA